MGNTQPQRPRGPFFSPGRVLCHASGVPKNVQERTNLPGNEAVRPSTFWGTGLQAKDLSNFNLDYLFKLIKGAFLKYVATFRLLLNPLFSDRNYRKLASPPKKNTGYETFRPTFFAHCWFVRVFLVRPFFVQAFCPFLLWSNSDCPVF